MSDSRSTFNQISSEILLHASIIFPFTQNLYITVVYQQQQLLDIHCYQRMIVFDELERFWVESVIAYTL